MPLSTLKRLQAGAPEGKAHAVVVLDGGVDGQPSRLYEVALDEPETEEGDDVE